MKAGMVKNEKRALLLMMPGAITTACLIIYPIIYIILMSFSKEGIDIKGFAGLSNYHRLFRNPQFVRAMWNTIRFTLVAGTFSYVTGLMLAILIHRKGIRWKSFWRSAIFIAWVIPGIVKATAWKWIFHTNNGILNYMLQAAGLIEKPVPWLTSPDMAMWSVAIVQIWACAPYVMLMMTAGIQQLPGDLFESAELDGAGAVRKLFRITLPMLKDISFICILMLFVWTLNEFSLIWVMTSGGQNTTTLSILIYNQFKVLNVNSASASSVMQLVVTLIFAVVYVKMILKDDN